MVFCTLSYVPVSFNLHISKVTRYLIQVIMGAFLPSPVISWEVADPKPSPYRHACIQPHLLVDIPRVARVRWRVYPLGTHYRYDQPALP